MYVATVHSRARNHRYHQLAFTHEVSSSAAHMPLPGTRLDRSGRAVQRQRTHPLCQTETLISSPLRLPAALAYYVSRDVIHIPSRVHISRITSRVLRLAYYVSRITSRVHIPHVRLPPGVTHATHVTRKPAASIQNSETLNARTQHNIERGRGCFCAAL